MAIPDPDFLSDQPNAPDLVAQLTAQLEQERSARQQAESAAQTAAAESARAQHVTEIALRYKLPTELAKRLQGNTPAEIEADAKQLTKSLGRWPSQWSNEAPITASPGLVSDPAQSSRATTLLDIVNGNRQSRPFRPSDE
jgi:hypothetical protein